MSTVILGLSAFYHDSAAALVVDGRVVAAAQEERFTRRKHDASFPTHAIAWCLESASLPVEAVDHVVFYEKPLLKFERLLETHLAVAPASFPAFLRAMPSWLHEKLHLPRAIRRGLGGRYRHRQIYVEHHEAHAASAFYPSPFAEAAVLTLDGVGEWATATAGEGRGAHLRLTHELRFPHSLGLLYSAFTYYCGFRVNSGEYKLMGLAPFGRPSFVPQILERLLDLKPDGTFRLDLSYFDFHRGLTMTSAKFHRLFGGPPLPPGATPTGREMDLAASIQQVTETIVLRLAADLHARTGLADLCLAGGVALNATANGRLARESPFARIWIQPAAGDAGGALGAALFTWHHLLGHARTPAPEDGMAGALLGPAFADDAVAAELRRAGAVFTACADEADLCARVAAWIDEGRVVGWVQGPMEFGPRALGARSILGDARDPAMQSRLNRRIKFRESFRPFAPAVLADRARDYFDLGRADDSPYMLQVAPVRADRRVEPAGPRAAGLDRVREARSDLPAVTHVDGSARVQTVAAARHPRLHRLLTAFAARTGCPVVINTSFNIRGEPIVCTPADALRCFLATDMDALAIGSCLLLKEAQPAELLRAHAGHRLTVTPD